MKTINAMTLVQIADRFREIGCGLLVDLKDQNLQVNAPSRDEMIRKGKWGIFLVYYYKIIKHPHCHACAFESHPQSVFVRVVFKKTK